eukprot:8067754-Pyramimonas_sp.AAC.1
MGEGGGGGGDDGEGDADDVSTWRAGDCWKMRLPQARAIISVNSSEANVLQHLSNQGLAPLILRMNEDPVLRDAVSAPRCSRGNQTTCYAEVLRYLGVIALPTLDWLTKKSVLKALSSLSCR